MVNRNDIHKISYKLFIDRQNYRLREDTRHLIAYQVSPCIRYLAGADLLLTTSTGAAWDIVSIVDSHRSSKKTVRHVLFEYGSKARFVIIKAYVGLCTKQRQWKVQLICMISTNSYSSSIRKVFLQFIYGSPCEVVKFIRMLYEHTGTDKLNWSRQQYQIIKQNYIHICIYI